LPSGPLSGLSADVIVAGAGVAGATTAAVLARSGWRAILVDPYPACPRVFKAEKVLRPEIGLLRDFGLLEPLLPISGRITELCDAFQGRIFRRSAVEQIGLGYPDLVDTLRANLPREVENRQGRVVRVSGSDGAMRLHLASGEELAARLIVLACGIGGPLLPSLGLRRRVIQSEQCVVFGFNVAPAGSQSFPFESVTYYSAEPASGIDYLTLFNFRDFMRANLFTFRRSNDVWTHEFLHEPEHLLQRALPGLPRVIGEYRVTSKVEFGRVDLYQIEGDLPDGVVFIGDALRNACPSTGLGLRKAFTDTKVLAECIPAWFSTPGMGANKLRSFYDDPRKRSMDAHALNSSLERRGLAVGLSPAWRVRRALRHLRWILPFPGSLIRAARRMVKQRDCPS
jgi:2-polyprenyl-6-methoxyphenol hydroxylase-like FAD-dependent oxidoreductase